MNRSFRFDVFLSYSSKDKKTVLSLATRLKNDGVRVWLDIWEIHPGDSIPSKIEDGLEQSRVLLLCMSRNAFGSDWPKLEYGTFRFRDPLNKERRLIPLRLDDTPIAGSLAQFLYVNWIPTARDAEYRKLLDACRQPESNETKVGLISPGELSERSLQLDSSADIFGYAFSPEGDRAITGGADRLVRIWDLAAAICIKALGGHTARIRCVASSKDFRLAASGDDDGAVRLWDVTEGGCLHILKGHTTTVENLAINADSLYIVSVTSHRGQLWSTATGQHIRDLSGMNGCVAFGTKPNRALSSGQENTVCLWDVEAGLCLSQMLGHSQGVTSIAWSTDERYAISGSADRTLRLWDVEKGDCLRVLEGHTASITRVAWSPSGEHLISGDRSGHIRFWDAKGGRCVGALQGGAHSIRSVGWSRDSLHAFSGETGGRIRAWDCSFLGNGVRTTPVSSPDRVELLDQVQYMNAKVLVVGDTSSGKSGLTHRLATGRFRPSEKSTVGAWSTQWRIPKTGNSQEIEQEIWLWDFGGQADQRLIHQLYMDRAALVLLLFDADREDVLSGLREWQLALRRSVPPKTPYLLVAGRIDAGFRASKAKLRNFALEHGFGYFETSALEGWGCEELIIAIMKAIPWETMERRHPPESLRSSRMRFSSCATRVKCCTPLKSFESCSGNGCPRKTYLPMKR